MTITVQAIYEDGVLKPSQPLPFGEHEQVHVTVVPAPHGANSDENIVQESYGLIKWAGTHEELQHILDESEEDFYS